MLHQVFLQVCVRYRGSKLQSALTFYVRATAVYYLNRHTRITVCTFVIESHHGKRFCSLAKDLIKLFWYHGAVVVYYAALVFESRYIIKDLK